MTHLECPSDASLLVFYIICAVLMSLGFAAIIAMAGEIIPEDVWVKKKVDKKNSQCIMM